MVYPGFHPGLLSAAPTGLLLLRHPALQRPRKAWRMKTETDEGKRELLRKGTAGPRATYVLRLAGLAPKRAELQSRERSAGYWELALAALTVAWALFRLRHFDSRDLLILIPIGLCGSGCHPRKAAARDRALYARDCLL